MNARLFLELDGRAYELKMADVNVFVKDNYVTVWADDRNQIDLKMLKGVTDDCRHDR